MYGFILCLILIGLLIPCILIALKMSKIECEKQKIILSLLQKLDKFTDKKEKK